MNRRRWSGTCGLDKNTPFLFLIQLLMSPHPLDLDRKLGPSKDSVVEEKMLHSWLVVIRAQRTAQRRPQLSGATYFPQPPLGGSEVSPPITKSWKHFSEWEFLDWEFTLCLFFTLFCLTPKPSGFSE